MLNPHQKLIQLKKIGKKISQRKWQEWLLHKIKWLILCFQSCYTCSRQNSVNSLLIKTILNGFRKNSFKQVKALVWMGHKLLLSVSNVFQLSFIFASVAAASYTKRVWFYTGLYARHEYTITPIRVTSQAQTFVHLCTSISLYVIRFANTNFNYWTVSNLVQHTPFIS